MARSKGAEERPSSSVSRRVGKSAGHSPRGRLLDASLRLNLGKIQGKELGGDSYSDARVVGLSAQVSVDR